MNELRDPFDRVSNSLRRAVSINKSKETDLRITMSTIQRERRRSMNSWSLKQEKFLRAKQKFMPDLKPQNGRRPSHSMVTSTRRPTLVRGVSPDSMVEAKPRAKFVSNQAAPSQTTMDDSPGNPLPPLIVPGKRTRHSHPEGITAPVAAICNQLLQEPLGPTESQLRRARRVSEYKAAMSTDGETESLQRRVRRFTEYREPAKLHLDEMPERLTSIEQEDANSPNRSEGTESVTVNTNFPRTTESILRADQCQNESMPNRLENVDKIGDDISSKRRHTSRERDNGLKRRLSALNIQERVQTRSDTATRDNWKKLRLSLKTVKTRRSKPNDVGKMSLIEMTKLFEEIRGCRYLRVGQNTSIRGDSAPMGQGCKCLACTVKDKTQLKNNMSAPQ